MTSAPENEESFGCAACWPASAEAVWEARGSLERRDLVDDSHLIIAELACRPCGQRFVSVFHETVDWDGGEDSQYWTVLPVTEVEAASLAGLGENALVRRLNGLAPQRRSLRRSYPKGQPLRVFWGHGITVLAT